MPTRRTNPQTSLKAPPLWYVRTGVTVVGPMTTASLLRGVAFGRVPDDSLVRGHAWDHWRRAFQIREVCALRKVQERAGKGWQPQHEWKPPTPDEEGKAFARKFLRASMSPGESMLLTLHAAVEATRAEFGLVHRFRSAEQAFVTSFTYGDGLEPLAGVAIPGHDAACAAAVDGKGVWGSQGVGSAQRAIMGRLFHAGHALRGVAMVPVRVLGRTYAMLELGRMDHPFRGCDKARLAGVRTAVEEQFVLEGWDPWPCGPVARPRPLLMPIA